MIIFICTTFMVFSRNLIFAICSIDFSLCLKITAQTKVYATFAIYIHKIMSKNKYATIRYRIIDEALQGGKKIKTEDLLVILDEKLAYYDIKGISMSQLRKDIKAMKEDEGLKYKADIKSGKNGYWYEDPTFSINKCPINKDDANQINEALTTLEQFKHFGFYKELQGIIDKVGQKFRVQIKPLKSIICFETVENYEGNKHLGELYQAIIKKEVLYLTYTPFNLPKQSFNFHPQLLKEHNNRWFLFGINGSEIDKKKQLRILPLDRITDFSATFEKYIPLFPADIDKFFHNIIGVGLPWENQNVVEIILEIKQPRGFYVLTKPIHHSQKLITETETHLIISLQLIPNREFYAQILWYGEDITVISPTEIRENIKQQLGKIMMNYEK